MRKSMRNFIFTDSLKTLNHLSIGRRINDMTDSNTFKDLRKYKEENNLCTKKDCGIKSKSKTFIRESVKKCCDGEKKYYLHYHFEYA